MAGRPLDTMGWGEAGDNEGDVYRQPGRGKKE